MDTDDLDETELYLEQLKEVFDSCDSFDKGYLNKDELTKLCYKLQLEEQAEAIVDYLTENHDEAKVKKKNAIPFELFSVLLLSLLPANGKYFIDLCFFLQPQYLFILQVLRVHSWNLKEISRGPNLMNWQKML